MDPTVIVALALLVIYLVLVFYYDYKSTYDQDLNPMQHAQLKLMLEYKTATVEAGNWLDNFILYARNQHSILSIFFPTSYNPINGAERVGILFITAVAAVALQSLRTAASDDASMPLDICIVSLPVLIVDYFLFYLATRQDVAIMERNEGGEEGEQKGEWCEEEMAMRQGDLKFLVATRNERAVVNRTNSKSNCGEYGFKCLVFSCTVVVCIFGFSGVSSGWLKNWLLAFAYWFITAPIVFSIKYCREDPFVFNDGDDNDDIDSIADVPELSPDEVKAFMEEWADDQCCYGAGAAQDIEIEQVVGKCTKKLEYSSWSESRWKEEREEKYSGGNPIGWSSGEYEPGIWEMDPPMGNKWEECSTSARVPGSERVVECDRCHGSGQIQETDSEGNTKNKTCPKCGGSGKRLKYRALIGFFGVRDQTYCLDVSSCPVYLVEECSGKQMECTEVDRFENEGAICNLQTEDVMFAGTLQTFNQNHREIEDNGNARINQQKYCVMQVALYEVSYMSKDDCTKKFYIIGDEREVYWPSKEFPTRCLHCCNCFDCNSCGKPSIACCRC